MDRSTRRTFLGKAAKAIGFWSACQSTFAGRLMAATKQVSDGYRALVCLDLEGGNDGNNVIVPFSSEQFGYYSVARQGLAIDRTSLLPVGDGHGAAYGFHPSLAKIQSRYLAGNAAVVANVGTLVTPDDRVSFIAQRKQAPDMLEDHEVQRVEWGTAYSTVSPSTGTHSGWGGRMADVLTSGSTLGYPVVTSLIGADSFTVGDKTSPATVAPGGGGGFPTDITGKSLMLAAKLNSGSTLVGAAANGLRDAIEQTSLMNSALAAGIPFKTAFPTTAIGAQLKQVATIMTVRSSLGMNRQIFLCKSAGFDLHSAQLSVHANLLAEVDQAVGAFMDFLDEQGLTDEVTVFTQSDFGRTLAMNVNAGSDHAWGNHQIVVGGAVKGNQIFGKFPSLELEGPDDLQQTGGWIPTTSIEQYGAPIASWFGVQKSAMTQVFPNLAAFAPDTISLFG